MVDFGNNLKTLRLNAGWTQSQLAQKLGITKSVISAYETGIRLPSYDILIHIAKIFKVSTDYLLGLEKTQEIDLSGLTDKEVTALLALIKAMKDRKTSFQKDKSTVQRNAVGASFFRRVYKYIMYIYSE